MATVVKGIGKSPRSEWVLPLRLFIGSFFLWLVNLALAQEQLTLSEAVRMALERNGNARAAFKGLESAEARVQVAQSRFFPSIAPNFNYQNSSTKLGSNPTSTQDERSWDITARWLLLDTGQRSLGFRQAKESFQATQHTTRETIRQIIFQTTRAYYDLLRRRELLKVAEASVERARTLYEVTKYQASPEIGTVPAKDVFQAEADLANSEVQSIAARNDYEVAQAELKRLIGWEITQPLPEPAPVPEPTPPAERAPLAQYWEQALKQRPDLRAAELEVQVQGLGVQSARIDTGPTFEISLNATRQFEPDRLEQRRLTFLASYPLFDGGLVRANLKSAKASYDSTKYRFEQAKRDAIAEVEGAYLTLMETERRLEASRKAVQAARKNYDAASESLKEGVGNIIEVITAQLSLVTAETNAVQAVYDYYIAELQLKLAVGEPLPEENL